LASCENCYAVYSDTARYLIDSCLATPEDTAFDDKVVALPSRTKFVVQWSSLAALLLVGVGGGTSFILLSPEDSPRATDERPDGFLLQLPDSSPESGFVLPTKRAGRRNGGRHDRRDVSASRGGQLVNLQMSLRAGKVEESQDVIARIFGFLKTQLFTDDLQKGYTAITADLANGKTPAQVLSCASRVALESGRPWRSPS
jgi:hypothetical protein